MSRKKATLLRKPSINVAQLYSYAQNQQTASELHIHVSVFLDETASLPLAAMVRSSYASAKANVRVTISYLGSAQAVPDPQDDIAIIAAGNSLEVGELYNRVLSEGVPCMVITDNKTRVLEIAETQGNSIDEADVISSHFDVEDESEESLASIKEAMGKWICGTCEAKRLSFAQAFDFVRRPLAIDCVNVTAIENGCVGLLYFAHSADLPLMTANQMKMILMIAIAYGQPVSIERIKELLVVLGHAYLMRGISHKIIDKVPALGVPTRVFVGYSATLFIGHVAVEYFSHGGGIAGLAKTIASARAGLAKIISGSVEEEEKPEAVKPNAKETINAIAENAKVIGGATLSATTPLVKSALKIGADSFVGGITGFRK